MDVCTEQVMGVLRDSSTDYQNIGKLVTLTHSRDLAKWYDSSRRPKPPRALLGFSPTFYAHSYEEGRDLVQQYDYVDWAGQSCTVPYAVSTLVGSLTPGSLPWPENPGNLAILLKIKDQKASLGVSLKEYRETSEMFYQCAHELVRLVRDVRRGRLKKILQSGVASMPSSWLLYRYGLSPFLLDVVAMAELLAGAADTSPLIKRVSSKQKVPTDRTVIDRYPYGNGYTYGQSTIRDVAWIEYENSLLRSATITGMLNVPQFLWEIIPLSFVADWMFSFGDYLASLDALTGVKQVVCTRTTKTENHLDLLGATGVSRFTTRGPLDVTTPTAPLWAPSMSFKRVLDGMALLTTIFGKDKNPWVYFQHHSFSRK